jgi:hypothetical protein
VINVGELKNHISSYEKDKGLWDTEFRNCEPNCKQANKRMDKYRELKKIYNDIEYNIQQAGIRQYNESIQNESIQNDSCDVCSRHWRTLAGIDHQNLWQGFTIVGEINMRDCRYNTSRPCHEGCSNKKERENQNKFYDAMLEIVDELIAEDLQERNIMQHDGSFWNKEKTDGCSVCKNDLHRTFTECNVIVEDNIVNIGKINTDIAKYKKSCKIGCSNAKERKGKYITAVLKKFEFDWNCRKSKENNEM